MTAHFNFHINTSKLESDVKRKCKVKVEVAWTFTILLTYPDLSLKSLQYILGCIKSSIANKAREVILPPVLLLLDPNWSSVPGPPA